MVLTIFLQYILPIVGSILLPLIIKWLNDLVSARLKKAGVDTSTVKYQQAQAIVDDVVSGLGQSIVSNAKTGGKWNSEFAKSVFQTAKAKLMPLLSDPEMQAGLKKIIGNNIEQWLESKIEAAVADNKPAPPVIAVPASNTIPSVLTNQPAS